MALALDHVFICAADPRAAERALTEAGVQIGLRAIHSGQGTSNACAFFDNAYLELLLPHDDQELDSAPVRPLALRDRLRWRQTGASPIGLALRAGNVAPSVTTWPYAAPFLPRGSTIPIVTPPDAAHLPLLFLIPAALPVRREPSHEHRGKRRRLTRVRVCGPRVTALASAVAALCDPAAVVLEQAPDHHLELEWDEATADERHDLRPTLPVTLRW